MKIRLSTIVRLCALILVVLFFVPTTIVSCEGYNDYRVEVSAFGVATGDLQTDYTDIDAHPELFAMLGLSLVLLFLGSKYPILGAVATAANVAMLYLMYDGIIDYVSDSSGVSSFTVTKTEAFTGYVVVCIVIVVLLLLKQLGIFEMTRSGKQPDHTDIPIDPVGDVSTVCPHCGGTVEAGNTFCGNCGQKIPRE